MEFITNEGVAPKGERYDRSALINNTENKLYKKTEYGNFIYSSSNLETGSIDLNKHRKATISPIYSIFQPTGDTTLLDDIKSLHQEFATKHNDALDKKPKDKLIQEFTSLAENLIK